MIFEVCAIVFTLAFIILVIFLISTLITLKETLKDTNESVKHLRFKAELLSSQSSELIHNVNSITSTLNEQLNTLDPVFDSVEKIGCAMKGFARNLNEEPIRIRPKKKTWQDRLIEGLEIIGLAAHTWKSHNENFK